MKYYDISDKSFAIYNMNEHFERMPRSVAERVSGTVLDQYNMTAGCRIRFSTNSKSLNVRANIIRNSGVGFDLYRVENGKEYFSAGFRKPDCFICNGEFEAASKISDGSKMISYTLNFPYAAKMTSFEIGIDDDAVLSAGAEYINEKPVVFYGSSITHGAWASRPGTTYEAMISQKYNLNYINLGFSGGAKGEKEIVDYMAGLDMCAFVCDYDHNAYDFNLLKATHLPMYQTIRGSHPDIPYIIITRPNYFADPVNNEKRNTVFKATYDYALNSGDKNVWYIDGKTLFDGEFYHNCTKDGCHPNDIGFYRMADVIGKELAAVLNIEPCRHDLRREDNIFIGDSSVEQRVDRL